MAVVILFGLLSTTTLNMLVVPIAYLKFSRTRRSYDAQPLQTKELQSQADRFAQA